MAVDDVTVQLNQIRRLLAEPFLGGRKLQDLGNVAQVSALQVTNAYIFLIETHLLVKCSVSPKKVSFIIVTL